MTKLIAKRTLDKPNRDVADYLNRYSHTVPGKRILLVVEAARDHASRAETAKRQSYEPPAIDTPVLKIIEKEASQPQDAKKLPPLNEWPRKIRVMPTQKDSTYARLARLLDRYAFRLRPDYVVLADKANGPGHHYEGRLDYVHESKSANRNDSPAWFLEVPMVQQVMKMMHAGTLLKLRQCKHVECNHWLWPRRSDHTGYCIKHYRQARETTPEYKKYKRGYMNKYYAEHQESLNEKRRKRGNSR